MSRGNSFDFKSFRVEIFYICLEVNLPSEPIGVNSFGLNVTLDYSLFVVPKVFTFGTQGLCDLKKLS